mgnify:CR=1 FL=1
MIYEYARTDTGVLGIAACIDVSHPGQHVEVAPQAAVAARAAPLLTGTTVRRNPFPPPRRKSA